MQTTVYYTEEKPQDKKTISDSPKKEPTPPKTGDSTKHPYWNDYNEFLVNL